jgi:hypothetical protein
MIQFWCHHHHHHHSQTTLATLRTARLSDNIDHSRTQVVRCVDINALTSLTSRSRPLLLSSPMATSHNVKVVSPADGKPFCHIADASVGDVDRAVAVARRAFETKGEVCCTARCDLCGALASFGFSHCILCTRVGQLVGRSVNSRSQDSARCYYLPSITISGTISTCPTC